LQKPELSGVLQKNDSQRIRFYGPEEPTQEFEWLKEVTAYANSHSNREHKVTVEI